MRKLKEVKPVVHCGMDVPSRWHAFHRTGRHVKKYADIEKYSREKKKDISMWMPAGHSCCHGGGGEPRPARPLSPSAAEEDSKGKEPHKYDSIPDKERDSVFYAREGRKKVLVETSSQCGAEGDVYKAHTPSTEAQGAPEVKEDRHVQVEVPVDQKPAEIVAEDEDIHDNLPDGGSITEKEDERPYEDSERKEDNSRMSSTERFSLRHNTEKKASLKDLSKNKKVVPFPEKEPYDILEGKITPVLLETPVRIEDQREPPMEQQSLEESSSRQSEEEPEEQELLDQSSWGQSSREQIPDKRESSTQPSLGQKEMTHGGKTEEQIP
ncbi:doublecortin domain-containing protein 2C isoform X9 [Crocuta crocuta]